MTTAERNRTMNERVKKALNELDFLEDILNVYDAKDFVEVVGGIGGDVGRYRVYFNNEGNVKYICEK